jgi:hypothetical protein
MSSPYDDFPSWELLLRTASRQGSDFLGLLQDAQELIFEILAKDALRDPISGHTTQFLTVTIPQTVRLVLQLTRLPDDAESALGFLQSSLSLATWAVPRRISATYTVAELLLCSENRSMQPLLQESFLLSGESDVVFSAVAEGDPDFDLMRMAMCVLTVVGLTADPAFLVKCLPKVTRGFYALQSEYRSEDKARKVNFTEFGELLRLFVRLVCDPVDEIAIGFRPLFEFFDFSLRGDFLILQLAVLPAIVSFFGRARDAANIAFAKWPQSFVDYIMTKSFHSDVIEKLVHVIHRFVKTTC